MTISKFSKYWTLLIILLVATITVGGIVAWSRYSGSQPVEISIAKSPSQEQLDKIYIGGAITSPGFYPLKAGDSIEALIQAAGGTSTSADLSQLKLYISEVGEVSEVGEEDGPFQNINELTKVEGIGTTTYEQIKHLITVAD